MIRPSVKLDGQIEMEFLVTMERSVRNQINVKMASARASGSLAMPYARIVMEMVVTCTLVMVLYQTNALAK